MKKVKRKIKKSLFRYYSVDEMKEKWIHTKVYVSNKLHVEYRAPASEIEDFVSIYKRWGKDKELRFERIEIKREPKSKK